MLTLLVLFKIHLIRLTQLQTYFTTPCLFSYSKVYVDTAVMMGQTGDINPDTKQFKNIVYMPCNPSNNFFPDVTKLPRYTLRTHEFVCSFIHSFTHGL